jgi:hypothetical protein
VPAGGSGVADLGSKAGHGPAPPEDLDAYVYGAVADGRHEGCVEGSEVLAVGAQLRFHRSYCSCRNDSALRMQHERP